MNESLILLGGRNSIYKDVFITPGAKHSLSEDNLRKCYGNRSESETNILSYSRMALCIITQISIFKFLVNFEIA